MKHQTRSFAWTGAIDRRGASRRQQSLYESLLFALVLPNPPSLALFSRKRQRVQFIPLFDSTLAFLYFCTSLLSYLFQPLDASNVEGTPCCILHLSIDTVVGCIVQGDFHARRFLETQQKLCQHVDGSSPVALLLHCCHPSSLILLPILLTY